MSAPSWLSPDSAIEVSMTEEGLAGSKYRARVLAVTGDRAQVEYEAFNEESLEGEEGEAPLLREWVPITILAPPPPPTPEGYFGKLKIGATLEVLFEDGWWTVTLKKMQKATPATAASYLVVAPAYQTERWAEETTLRPQWAFRKGGVWEVVGTDVSASAAASSGGAAPAQRKVGAKAKATASKTDEPAAKRGRGAGGASSSSGPGRGGGRGRGGAGRGGSTSRASVAAATPAAPAASSVVIAVPAGRAT